MSALTNLRAKVRYAAGLQTFLRHTLTADDARQLIEQRTRNRTQSFLSVTEKAIYQNPASPYLKLLRWANIEFRDLRQLVEETGIEGALHRLYDLGIHVTLDEFKGRQPVRRSGLEFAVGPADFDNPLLGVGLQNSSSGSRGAPTRAKLDFTHLADESTYWSVIYIEGHERRPIAMCSVGAASSALRLAKLGKRLDKNFMLVGPPKGLRARVRFAGGQVANHALGFALPWPEFVPPENFGDIARWLAERKALGAPALLLTFGGPAVRICLAARDHHLDIEGTVFSVGGEPYTAGKAKVLESVGARAKVAYTISELGAVGCGCEDGAELDDVHLLTDKLAVIQPPKMTSAGTTVPSLFYTGLLQNAPKVMLNTESGDYGSIEQRHCNCPFGQLGFATHLSGIRSYEKLTSESVTFLGSTLYRLLEEVLPARFGGEVYDYQVAEEEHEGLPKISIVIAPSVGDVDEAAVIETVLQEIGEGGVARLWADLWRQAGTLRVVRRLPHRTGAKILPLHVVH